MTASRFATTRRTMLRAAGVLAPLAVAGCGTVLSPQPYAQRTDWPLAPPPPSLAMGAMGAMGGGSGTDVILVRNVEAGPGLDQRGLITIQPNGAVHQGYYNRWAVPPAQAVTSGLIAWLAATKRFAAVVGDGSVLTQTLTVEATLDGFNADLRRGTAQATMILVVARPSGFRTRPILQVRLAAAVPLAGRTAPDLVAAQRHALAKLLGSAVQAVMRAAASKRGG